MSKLQQMREAREAAGAKILELRNKIRDENRDFNTEERSAWEASNKDFDDLGRRLDDIAKGDAVERALAERMAGKPGAEDKTNKRTGKRRDGEKRSAEEVERDAAVAMQAWFRKQSGKGLTRAHVEACQRSGFNPNRNTLRIRLSRDIETRAQGVGSGSIGGNLVPTGFVASLEVALKQYASVRKVAHILRTDDGRSLPWPSVNDTANSAGLVNENTQVTETAVAFGQKTYGAYKFTSGLVLVGNELDVDSAIDMTSTVGGLLGERLGRGQNGSFTTGTGSSQPGGIVTGATLGVTAASPTAIAADELFTFYHSVDPEYRDDPSCGWMFHDNVAMAIRKLKDSQNRYLWDMDALRGGQSPTLLGKPVTVNQSMASTIATTNKTMLFGALNRMKIRDAGDIRVRRLVERYADYDQVGFVAFQRCDSGVLNAGTNPIKYFQQA
jgi:HK97 family phage major capsid protein